MVSSKALLSLDIGEKRIGVALADTSVNIAIPYDTIDVDGTEIEQIAHIVINNQIAKIIVGYPRNQSGEPTIQTAYVESVAEKLKDIDAEIIFQDESLTSVMAEDRLKAQQKHYTKADIDAMAACIILQDYLEAQYGRV